jgi:hypothetical protein
MKFSVYGYEFELRGSAHQGIEAVAKDFDFFRVSEVRKPSTIEIADEDPPYENLPDAVATVYTPRNISFTQGNLTYIDYSGRGVAIYNRETGDFRISSRDPHLQYEACYLFLISRTAEFLDRQAMHRVHALGISYAGRAALFLLPMGGGKSTLGMHLLTQPGMQMLSDDSPFIDSKGRVYAYPLRLGLLPDLAHTIPPEYIRRIDRMEFGPKLLVDSSYFKEKIASKAEPGMVFVGRRSLRPECTIRPLSFTGALRSMIANCIVGMGLFQGMEFVLREGPWGILSKGGIAFSRLRCSIALIRRSKCYEIVLGRDLAGNAKVVSQFLDREFKSSAATTAAQPLATEL